MKRKRHIWVIESRDKRNDEKWGRWIIGTGYSSRREAVFAGNPGKDECGEVRITRYDSSR